MREPSLPSPCLAILFFADFVRFALVLVVNLEIKGGGSG